MCPNRKLKDKGWRGGVSKSLLQGWVRRPSKTQLHGWRSRSSRGHCGACSFFFCLLLGYRTLLFSIMGCSVLRFLCTVAPPLALSLSSLHLSPCFWHFSFVIFFYSSSWILLQRNASKSRDALSAGGFKSVLPQGVMWNVYLQGLPLVGTCKTNKNSRQ